MDNTSTQLRTPPGTGAPVVPEQDVSPLNERSTRRPPAIDRLSAVPSTMMVRDPKINIDSPYQEETRPKRASSIGASIRRLFSKSPSHAERSSSETTKVSPLGHETSESAKLAGQRGRTPPKLTSSANTSGDSDIPSTLPPNNHFFDATLKQDWHKRGDYSASIDRAAMASHRGYDSGQHGGTWREQVITEIPGVLTNVQPTSLEPQRDVVAIGAAWRPDSQISDADNGETHQLL